ncbi:MAG: restriction endonuclease subunit S [Chloroflexi bacterium]|nr:restriction endonuclease subunit S [Chloroflexota bacterium]
MSNQNNNIHEGFKMTEIGLLPDEWAVVSLRKVATVNKVAIDPQIYPNESFEYYSIPAYQVSSSPILENGHNIHSQKLIVNAGTVLFGKLNPRVPKVWLVESTSNMRKLASTEFIPLVPMENLIVSGFLYYLAWSSYVMPKAQELVSGSTPSRQRVDTTAFGKIIIPLPLLPEQKAIAGVLSTIQKAIETQDKIIAAARELKKSLMRHLFTYGPVPVSEAERVPLKETEIGPVPEHWEVKQLVNAATLQRGKDLPKQNQVPGKYPIVGSSGIIGYHNQFVCTGPGVVTGRSGSIGNFTYIEEDYWPHNTGLYVKDFHGNNPKFIYYLFHSVDFHKYATGVSVPTLNRNFVHSALVAIPPIVEQQEIARMLSSVDKKIEIEENRKVALQALFKTMLHHLMTGKVRVKDMEAIHELTQ